MKYVAPFAEAVELDVVNVLLASEETGCGEDTPACETDGICAQDGCQYDMGIL